MLNMCCFEEISTKYPIITLATYNNSTLNNVISTMAINMILTGVNGNSNLIINERGIL